MKFSALEALPDEQSRLNNLTPLEIKLSLALNEMVLEARERNRAAGETVFNPAALDVAIEALRETISKAKPELNHTQKL